MGAPPVVIYGPGQSGREGDGMEARGREQKGGGERGEGSGDVAEWRARLWRC